MTPFQALYGYQPPSLLTWNGSSQVQTVQEHQKQMEDTIRILKDNLAMARNRMKQQADAQRSERSFQKDDWVFLRLQPYKQTSLNKTKTQKLAPRYFGPYQILDRIGEVAYKLNLPTTSKIHDTFHVSCLKKKIGDKIVPQTSLPELNEEGKIMLEPEGILQIRTRQLRTRQIKEYLIKWQTLDIEDATWESDEWIQQFPKLPML